MQRVVNPGAHPTFKLIAPTTRSPERGIRSRARELTRRGRAPAVEFRNLFLVEPDISDPETGRRARHFQVAFDLPY
jgi:hypothetical protein